MEDKKRRFTDIDPYTCDLETLESEVKRLEGLSGYYETKQLALKKFINSVYGATASKFFIAHNTDIAESITLQGQDLNHYSENSVNDYFSGIFQNDTELHKKLGISTEAAKQVTIDKGKTTPMKKLDLDYLKGDESLTCAGDTDSVSGDTLIYVEDDSQMRIDNYFKISKFLNKDIVIRCADGSEVVPVKGGCTLTIDNDFNCKFGGINYIMRHKVTKPKFTITSKSGKKVEVTGDHSCIVVRNGELISIKAKDINIDTDKLVTLKKVFKNVDPYTHEEI